MKTTKDLIFTIIIILAIISLMSYCTNPYMKLKIDGKIEQVKNNMIKNKETISEQIPGTEENLCIKKAEELIPKYIIHYRGDEYSRSHLEFDWKDKINYYRDLTYGGPDIYSGTGAGQNTNLHYYSDSFNYKKKIIQEDGIILGHNEFNFYPEVLKELPLTLDLDILLDSKEFIAYYNWSGFDEDEKKLIGESTLQILIVNQADEIICSLNTTKESGSSSCDFYPFKGRSYNIRIKTIPDFVRSNIYEVLNYSIRECGFVD